MPFDTLQVSLFLTATAIIVLTGHAAAQLFSSLRQPAVIGEIFAGLVLGPTALGMLAPKVQAELFAGSGAASAALAALAHLGLLLLMFVTGGELQVRVAGKDHRTVAAVTVAGLVLPFLVATGVVTALDQREFSGPNGTRMTFALVFGIAVAVTSIPVISRIMLDLNLLNTAYARTVLSVAVIEDIVLYALLAVLLALAHDTTGSGIGLWALLGVRSTVFSVAYHVLATVVFLGCFLLWGNRVLHRLLHSRGNIVARRSPVAFRIALLLAVVLLGMVLDVNPIFGALLTGLCVRRSDLRQRPSASAVTSTAEPVEAEPGETEADGTETSSRSLAAWESIRQFSLAFFIPIYFVTVGLKLDLARNFDPLFFAWFLLLCCLAKVASVWVGARLAGVPPINAIDLAVGLNARGGPGIVLATVTLDAGVINSGFFTSIVLLSILTAQVTGYWLDRRRAALAGPYLSGSPSGAHPVAMEIR